MLKLRVIKPVSLLFMFFFITSVYAQKRISISAKVVGKNQAPVEYFDALILNPKDSTVIDGQTCFDGKLELSKQVKTNFILQIKSLAYKSFYIPIDISKNSPIKLPTIELQPLNIELDEVSVTSKRTTVKMRNGNLKVDVKNSFLSNSADIADMLNRTPGILVDKMSNSINVIGKGQPLVYVNGKPVSDMEQLNALQPENIKTIEVIRNPSAKYDASAKAVILITTNKLTKDKLNLQVYSKNTKSRQYGTSNGLSINSKYKKLQNYFSYSLQKSEHTQFAKSKESLYNLSLDTILLRNGNTTKDYGNLSHNLFYAAEYEINTRTTIGIQTTGRLNNFKQNSSDTTSFLFNKQKYIDKEILSNTNDLNKLFESNLNFSKSFGSASSLKIYVDWLKKDINSELNSNERNITDNYDFNTNVQNEINYSVYTGQVDFDTKWLKLNLHSGIYFSYIKNASQIEISTPVSFFSDKGGNLLQEKVGAAYFSLDQSWKKLTIKGGLRFENSQMNAQEKSKNVLSKIDNNFFPNLTIEYDFSDAYNLSLSYSQHISRPNFREMNPEIGYADSLAYSQGNPLLLPELVSNINLSVTLASNLFLSFDYDQIKNKKIQATVIADNSGYIQKFSYVNIPQSKDMALSLVHNFGSKFLSNSTYLGVIKPFLEIEFQDKPQSFNQPLFYASMNSEFSLPKNISFFTTLNYTSSGSTGDNSIWEDDFEMDLGFYRYFHKKTWYISLEVDDILNTSNYGYTDMFSYSQTSSNMDRDTRMLRISLKYNFNHFRKLIEDNSNTKQLQRL